MGYTRHITSAHARRRTPPHTTHTYKHTHTNTYIHTQTHTHTERAGNAKFANHCQHTPRDAGGSRRPGKEQIEAARYRDRDVTGNEHFAAAVHVHDSHSNVVRGDFDEGGGEEVEVDGAGKSARGEGEAVVREADDEPLRAQVAGERAQGGAIPEVHHAVHPRALVFRCGLFVEGDRGGKLALVARAYSADGRQRLPRVALGEQVARRLGLSDVFLSDLTHGHLTHTCI